MKNDLVKVPLLLVEGGSQTVGPLHVHHEILHLVLKPLLRLLQRGALRVHRFDLFFSLLETLRELFPAQLTCINWKNTNQTVSQQEASLDNI